MFTRIGKGFLIILTILVFIAAIGAGIATDNMLLFFIILAIGVVLLMTFGLYIELCNNVMDIKVYLKREAKMRENYMSQENAYVAGQGAAPVMNTFSNSSEWFCSSCGQKNKMSSNFCSGCGKAK